MIKNTIQSIHTIFNNIWQKFRLLDKKNVFRSISLSLIYLLCFLGSGYCSISLNTNTFTKTLLSLITFILSGCLYFLLTNFSSKLKEIKTKKIDFSVLVLLTIGITSIVTMFVNGDSPHLMSYIGFGLNVINGYLISNIISPKKAIKHFINIMFVLCLLSLYFYIIFLISRMDVMPSLGTVSKDNHYYINYFFLSFQNINSYRLQSIFWEPGLFATFLLLTLTTEIYAYEKIPVFKTLIFVICLILTLSTFAYFCFIFIVILFLYKKMKNRKIFYLSLGITIFLFLMLIVFYDRIVSVLAFFLPSVFSKLQPGSDSYISLTTRLYSPYVNLLNFIKNPFVGLGIINADSEYLNYISTAPFNNVVDAQTSTTFMLMAQFGLFGLIPTLFFIVSLLNMKKNMFEKILLVLFFLVISNKEPQSGMLLWWIILFSLIRSSLDKKDISLLDFDKLDSGTALYSFFDSSDDSIVKKNSYLSLLIRALALFVGLIATPIYNYYFGGSQQAYGVWLTLLSILSWIMMLDFGLGNGLKNRLIENDFANNKKMSMSLISNTYFLSLIATLALAIIGTSLIRTLDISIFFINDVINLKTIRIITTIVFLSICLEFTLKNVANIFQAMQKQVIASLFPLITSVSMVLFASIARIESIENKLIFMSIVYAFSVNIPLLVATIVIFSKKMNFFPLKFKLISKDTCRSLLSLGIAFFAIQIALLIINSSNQFLLSSNFGSEYSATYEYYSKFFMMLYSLFSMLTLPYWAMIAKAKKQDNLIFIKKMMRKLLIYALVIILFGSFILVMLQPIFDIWINDSLDIPVRVNYLIAFLFYLCSSLLIIIGIFTTLLNGYSKVKGQIIGFSVASILKITSFFVFKEIMPSLDPCLIAILSNAIGLLPAAVIIIISSMPLVKEIKQNAKL